MCLAAAAHIVEHDRFADLGITDPRLAELVAESWRRRAEQPSVYGRFDLRYDGDAARPRCWSTTPTPRPRWWRRRARSGSGWRTASPAPTSGTRCTSGSSTPGRGRPPCCRPARCTSRTPTADELGEDLMTVAYLRETAEQAGLDTEAISVEEIGWDRLSGRFVDERLRFIRACFKLYPWEWLATDEFGPQVLDTLDNGGGTGTTLLDRARLEDAALQQGAAGVLWELFPGHPNLLPAYLDGPRELAGTTGYVGQAAARPRGRRRHPAPGGRRAVRAGARTSRAATRSWPRCPTSTATGSCSARGSSRTRRRGSASGSRRGRSRTSTPASCPTSSSDRTSVVVLDHPVQADGDGEQQRHVRAVRDLDAVRVTDPEPLAGDLGDGVAVRLDLVLLVDQVAVDLQLAARLQLDVVLVAERREELLPDGRHRPRRRSRSSWRRGR